MPIQDYYDDLQREVDRRETYADRIAYKFEKPKPEYDEEFGPNRREVCSCGKGLSEDEVCFCVEEDARENQIR